MKKIFTFVAAATMLAACAKETPQVPANDFYAPAENGGQVAVLFNSNVTASVQTKAQGGVDAWNGKQNLYIYGFQRVKGGIDYSVVPFINNVLAVSPVEGAADNVLAVIDKADNKPFYYVGNYTYDFYGYYVDDFDVEPVADASGVRVPLVLTGGEDIMLAKADPVADVAKARSNGTFTGDNTWNDQYAYSAYAARRGVQPSLVFKHQLVRFTFQITSGSEFEDDNRLTVTGLSVNARNVADLCVAGTATGLVNIQPETAALELKSFVDGAVTDLEEYVVPNASEVVADGSNVLGESLMVIPNSAPVVGESDKYSMVLSMVQDGKSIDYPVDIKFSDVTGSVEGQTQFTAGYSYRITIKVYGLEKVEVSAELEPWMPGGDVEIDTDDAPEII